MRKVFSKINIPALLTTVALIMLILAVPDFTYAQGGSSPGFWSRVASAFEAALLAIPGAISIIILKLATLLTHLSGMILNYVVQFTVVEMSAKIEGLPMINLAWRTIRDVANMAFIFVLLYAAITTILGMGEDNKKLIVRVVIVAILINFSLFFTKLVIDASNVIAISFYDAIAPGATAQNLNLGISSNLMGVLNLQSIYDATGGIPGADLLTIGVMGTILALVAAFVFFAISIMLVIRFVVLIFTMILSPIAFMSFILPQLSKYRDQWWNALSGQAFFAPIYFLLTWIVIVISRGILGATGGTNGNLATALGGMVGPSGERIPANEGSIALLVNFIIVIVLLIASLMIAKEWANKAGSGVSSATKWAMGAAGGAVFGGTAALTRNIVGSRAAAMAEDENLKGRAAAGSRLAKLQLYTANKAAGASFDIRGAGLGGQLEAGKAKKGGFLQDQKDRAKAYEKYRPSKTAGNKAENEVSKAKNQLITAENEARERARKEINKHSQLVEAEKEFEEARREAAQPIQLTGLSAEEKANIKSRLEERVKITENKVKQESEKLKKEREQFIKAETTEERGRLARARLIRMEISNRMDRMASKAENSGITLIPKMRSLGPVRVSGVVLSGKDKAAAIRAAARGKSRKEQIAELAIKEAEEENKEKESSQETKPQTPTAEEKPKET